MNHAAPVIKVMAYVVWRDCLLVFEQPERPEQGVQVPGGSIEPGESLAAAVLREAHEETGLTGLTLVRPLGTTLYELKVDVGPPHLRHFFELGFAGQSAQCWQHRESVLRELRWEPLATLSLDWEMGAWLHALR